MCPAKTTKIGAATVAGGVQMGVDTQDAARATTRWNEPMGVAGAAVTSKPYALYFEEGIGVSASLAGWEVRFLRVEYTAPPEYLSISPGLSAIAITGPFEYVENLEMIPALEAVAITAPYEFEEFLAVSPELVKVHFSIVQDQEPEVMLVSPGLEGVLIS